MSHDDRIQALLDKQDILEVLYRYCQGCDRSDAEVLRGCFHPEAVTDHAGMVMPSWDWIPAALAWLETRSAVTHMIANPLIRVAGDRAVSDCHFVAYNRTPRATGDGWEEFFVKGRYLDRFERRDGAWKILRRTGLHDVERVVASSAQADAVSGEHRSGKAPGDLFYSLVAEFEAGR